VVPAYAGIERLEREGDQFQWGGPMLGEGGRFATPDGRARFTPLLPPEREAPPGRLRLSTRRGKQFNSMVFGPVDTPLGQRRDEVMLAPEDLRRLGLAPGDRVTVRSATGSIAARAVAGDLAPGTLMMYWPEANVLIPRGVVDPQCGIPAYRDTLVEVTPATGAPA
jgi:anaerobic selenocysteine-containing dehydrogenase